MKSSLFAIFTTLFIIGCSSKNVTTYKGSQDIAKDKSLNARIDKLVDSDPDLTDKQKVETKAVLYKGLDRVRELRMKESALASEVLRMSLVENATYKQIKAKKKEMKKIYDAKYENFYDTIAELKKIVGIRPVNNRLIHSPIMQRIFRRGSGGR